MLADYTTSKLIEYLDNLCFYPEDCQKLEQIKNKLLELKKLREDIIKFFGKGEVKFE